MNPNTGVWFGWFASFLTIELGALIGRHRVAGGTLSALVWRATDWRKRPWAKVLFGIGWVILGSHFLFHTGLIPGL